MQRQSKTSDNSGFTLVELAIVLVVVGILLGVGSSMVGVLSGAVKVRQAKDSLDENSQAVASWASANNRLPQITDFATSITPVAKTQMDSWSRPFVFLYDSNLAPATATKDTICGRRSTSLTVTTSNPPTTVANVAYVLLTGGDTVGDALNSSFAIGSTFLGGAAYTVNTPIPRLSSSNTAVGGNATGNILIDPTNTDIARWVTLDELRSKVGCQGAPMKIVNNELPFIPASTLANSDFVTISADGGVPISGTVIASQSGDHTWCVEFAPRRGLSMFDTSPSGGVKITGVGASCWASPETTGNYVQANTLALRKRATLGNFSTGSYQITVVARDGAAAPADTTACDSGTGDNCVRKNFVLTINPN